MRRDLCVYVAFTCHRIGHWLIIISEKNDSRGGMPMDKTNRTDALKAWEDLTIADNFIFQKVMRKKRLCK